MPTPALLLLIATLLPLASFTLLLFVGKRMGNPLAGYVGTLAICGSVACSLLAATSWMNRPEDSAWGMGKGPINLPMAWIPIGHAGSVNGLAQDHPGFLDLGIFVDSLTITMFCMITVVAALVHIFSIGYMHEDKRFPRFFTYLGLFCFSMLGLVLGGTLLQLFVFWELVGLCSYLLIGFWYEKKSASNAAIKAFVTNRVGDFGFLIGFGILFYHLGNASLPQMWTLLGNAGHGGAIRLSDGTIFTPLLLTIMGVGLFCGAIGKSAQFPLHVWLPDAMEGPTPVSALIHAATMVAAGVYLVGRIFPLLTPDAKLVIAIIGLTTLTMAALIAVVQSDIKKVLAFSTLSQLGYMIMAMGIGSWVGGLFHLITHAFFKALLFLGSGSVIAAAHHEQELGEYGGLLKKIPVTAVTFGIAVFAIAGTGFGGIGFSGYYSKDMILTHAGAFAFWATHDHGKSAAYWLFFLLPTIIAYVTAFYMTRCWMLTFWGKPRNKHLHEHAREHAVMTVPLIVLAILSVVGGKLFVQDLLDASLKENTTYCRAMDPGFHGFDTAWPAAVPDERGAEPTETADNTAPASAAVTAHLHGHDLVEKFVSWAFLVGIGLGFLMYMNGYAVARKLTAIRPLAMLHTWLYHRMYFDELYMTLFVGMTLVVSKLCGAFDKYIVDGLVNLAGWVVRRVADLSGWNDRVIVDGAVNGAGQLSLDLGALVRTPQTGRIRVYVTVLMVAVVLGLAGAIIVVLSS